jgi:PAS domain S-box-containing protein
MVIERLRRPKVTENGHGEAPPHATPQFLEALGVAVYTTDADGFITSFNEAAVELWGRRPEIGKDKWCGSWRLYSTDGRPMAHDECPMGITLRENRSVRGAEAIAERPDGTRVWFEPYPTPLRDGSGALVGAVNVLVDITERKRAEGAESYLSAIITSCDDAIVSKDLDGKITSWNQGAERLFGYTAEEACGQSIRLIIPSDRQSEEDEVLSRVRRGECVEHFETVRKRKDGSEIDISLTVSPVKNKAGRVIGASKIAHDISERKEAERALADALAVKDEFIGLVSHELRTPVTTIVGNAAILAKRQSAIGDEGLKAAVGDIRHEADRLNGIIENLLTLARFDHGALESEPVALNRLVETAVREERFKSGRTIHLRADDAYGAIVAGDERLLGHVIGNYLSNAEKYSPPGSEIEVVIDQAEGQVRVRVLDRGIGIDPAEAERLFDSFYRSKNVGSVGGIGIGLSVCRRLIRAIDGECWAAAREGGGSEFGFSLPVYAD